MGKRARECECDAGYHSVLSKESRSAAHLDAQTLVLRLIMFIGRWWMTGRETVSVLMCLLTCICVREWCELDGCVRVQTRRAHS